MTIDPAHHAGPDAVKSTGNVILTFGMVSVPLSVYAGSSDGIKVDRHEFTTAGDPVGRSPINKTTGVLLEPGTVVVKKATASDGTLVEVTDDELAAATTVGVNGTSEIIAFVPLDTIGSVYLVDGVSQLRPAKIKAGAKKVPNPAAEKAFCLIRKMMADKAVAALFKVKLRGPARFAALTPDGRMLTLAFAEQVRPPLELADAEFSDAEMAMANTLFDTIGLATPVLADVASAEIQAFVDAKATGTVTAPVEAPVAAPDTGDLMAALVASVKAAEAKAPAKKSRAKKIAA